MRNETKATAISAKVRREVKERDEYCVYCGAVAPLEIAHYVNRANGGKGIPENLVLLCGTCHFKQHNTSEKSKIEEYMGEYLRKYYKDWDSLDLSYHKN